MTGSPMAKVLREKLEKIEASDILKKLNLQKKKNIFLSVHREEKIDTEKDCTSVELNEAVDYGIPMNDYIEENVSVKVVKIIQSYTGVVNKVVWGKMFRICV